MKLKKLITKILCFLMIISLYQGQLVVFAEESNETDEVVDEEIVSEDDLSTEIIEFDENTEDSVSTEDSIDTEVELVDDYDDGLSIEAVEESDDVLDEDADLTQKTYMDEAVALNYNTTVTHTFSKGIRQRKVYKITTQKDAILTYKGKVFADSNDTDNVYVSLWDEDGKEIGGKWFNIYTSKGFNSFDYYCYLPKGNYLIFENGNQFDVIGTDSISFTATLTYPKSSEKEANDNFNKAQTISGDSTQYGVFTYDDTYDTYKINVKYSGDLVIDFEGWRRGDHDSYEIYLYDSDGNKKSGYTVYYDSNAGYCPKKLVKSVSPGIYYFQIKSYQMGHYNFTVTSPTKTNGTVSSSGICCIQNSPSIKAGMSISKSNYYDDVEYRWVGCDSNTPGQWFEISPWSTSNQWIEYTPKKSGNYVLVCYARVVGNEVRSQISCQYGVEFHKYIKAQCQMPYTGRGGGYLIGFETYSNPNQSYSYEMLILDCNLYQQGKDAWVYSTGKCKVAQGNALWTIWQPQYGYYWTLFRLYDKKGNLIDEVCYGFQNVF